MPHLQTKPGFIQPMLLLRAERLPEGPDWVYEQLDGYRAVLDEAGTPSFSALQNYGSSQATTIVYYVFDVMILAGRDLTAERLDRRKQLLVEIFPLHLRDPIRLSPELPGTLDELIHAVSVLVFEGLVAKRRDSKYESGGRSGAWAKMRVNRSQEFVIGGHTVGGRHFDALIFGYWEGGVHSGRARAVAPAVPRS